jgi:hypothetical protein
MHFSPHMIDPRIDLAVLQKRGPGRGGMLVKKLLGGT